MIQAHRVTIITPAYNCAATIREVVQSVENQAPYVSEHVIVDDGSSDETLSIIRELESREGSIIRVFSQPNSGEANAVNRGVAGSTGDFVMVVNADDPLLRDCVLHLRKALIDMPDAVVSYGDWKMINSAGETIKIIETLPFSVQTLVADWVCIVGPGAMIRRSALRDEPARDARYKNIGDYEMWLRLATQGPFVRVDKVLSTWRNHATGASWHDRGCVISDQYERLMEEYFNRGDLPEEIKSFKKRAQAHQNYYSGLQKLFDSNVAGRRMILRSWLKAPVLRYEYPSVKRSIAGSLAVLTFPFSLRFGYLCGKFGITFPPLIEDAISKRYR
jgi:glycosyltransferase involved in cell wall biosynthesis